MFYRNLYKLVSNEYSNVWILVILLNKGSPQSRADVIVIIFFHAKNEACRMSIRYCCKELTDKNGS